MSSSPRTEASQFVYVTSADMVQTDSTAQNWVMVEDVNAVSESERQRLDRIEQAQTEAIAKRVIQQQQALAPNTGPAPVAPLVNSESILVALAAAEAEEASKMAFREKRRQEDRASLELIASMQAGGASRPSPATSSTNAVSSPAASPSGAGSCSCLGASAGIHRKDCPVGGRP